MVNINQKLAEGYIHGKFILELVGKPKEHIERTMSMIIDKIKENKNIEIVNKDVSEATELEKQKGFFSTFAELELLLSSLPVLMGFCFDYMPSSVDIISPEELKLKSREINNFFNDLQARLYRLDGAVKQLSIENKFLKKNTNILLKNTITLLLLKAPLTCEEMSKAVGFNPEDLRKFLDKMVEEKHLKKEDNKYSLAK